MDAEQKKKLELLKTKAKINERKQSLQKNLLLQECLEALSSYSIVEDENEIEHIDSLASSPDLEIHPHADKITLQYY